MQKRLLPILHKYNNVAIYACGHIHNFQHIRKKGDNIDYVVNSSSSLARPVKPIDGTVFCSPADMVVQLQFLRLAPLSQS